MVRTFRGRLEEYDFLDESRYLEFIYEDSESDRQDAYGVTLAAKIANDGEFNNLNQAIQNESNAFTDTLFPAQTTLMMDPIGVLGGAAPANQENNQGVITTANMVIEGYVGGMMVTTFDGETLSTELEPSRTLAPIRSPTIASTTMW